MNFDDYEQKRERLYAEFADLVKLVLETAISDAVGIPRPQSLQCRAKSAASLKPKLLMRGLLESESIEKEIKDLAGARLIFYTNSDVDRFLHARLIPLHFEVDWKETRIHHPTSENAQRRYQAIHYTVYLSPERTALPEFAKFKGMRCEIQIQTILNHAWAETSHDILYKVPDSKGFGTKAFQSIEKRMLRIMDEYLLPAGYELQKVHHDFERFMQGKALFGRGTLETLAKCENNNDRYDVLSTIKEYVIPNYDDLQGIYPELCHALLEAVQAARTSEQKPIESAFGNLAGKTPKGVATLSINILDNLRYVDIEKTFQSLAAIFRDEPDKDVRNHVLKVVESLARYNLRVWRQAGPAAQAILAEMISQLSSDDREALRPLVLIVWRALLGSELRGTSVSEDAITISTGAVPPSPELRAIRDQAIDGLFELFDQSSSPAERSEVFSALMAATYLPIQANYSNDLCTLVLDNTRRIVEALTGRITGRPYDFLEHVEHEFLRQYTIARQIAEDEQNRFGNKDDAEKLTTAILKFRGTLNADEQFVRYKTLVGFESVFPPHWEGDSFDFEETERYRRERAKEYIDGISDVTEEEWYRLVAQCAATESDDLATFPVFGDFIYGLAKTRPAIAVRYLERADAAVLRFIPEFLNGLADSGADQQYRGLVARYLADGMQLYGIARHFRNSKTVSPALIEEVLGKAISLNDDFAVIECLLLATEQHDPQNRPLVADVFVPAIRHLISRKNSRWVNGAWFLKGSLGFFSALSSDHAGLVLESLSMLSKIDYRVENILAAIAQSHPIAIWEFLERRINHKRDEDEERYESFPYQFHGLERPLAANVELAIETVRKWYGSGDPHFRFNGGRLLGIVFPGFPDEFARALSGMATNASDEDVGFILGILHNYKGEPATHAVLKALINRLPVGDSRLAQIESCLQNAGVVSGEFGFVEAFRRKKAEVAPWLEDERPSVRVFAEEYIRRLDVRIASEQRSAEHSREQQRRAFEDAQEQ